MPESPSAGAAPRADAARNAARILEAARATIREQGPGVPFYEIAKAAGVGQATLYRHFPNKQTLVRSIVEENVRLLEEATGVNGHEARFDMTLETLAVMIAENAELSALLASEVGSDWYDGLLARIVDLLASTLDDADHRGLDRVDLRLILGMLGGAVTGSDSIAERRRTARRASRLLLEGLA